MRFFFFENPRDDFLVSLLFQTRGKEELCLDYLYNLSGLVSKLMPVILALRSWRQEDCHEFKASLGYRINKTKKVPRLALSLILVTPVVAHREVSQHCPSCLAPMLPWFMVLFNSNQKCPKWLQEAELTAQCQPEPCALQWSV